MAEDPTERSKGLTMKPQETWRVFEERDLQAFVAHLDILFPEGSALYLEGSSIAEDIREFAESRKPEKVADIRPSTGPGVILSFCPPSIRRTRLICLHMMLTRTNLDGLVSLIEHHADPEVCDHLHVYNDDVMLLEGYDWGYGQLYVTGEIPEDKVRAFCQAARCRYERSRDLVDSKPLKG